MRKVLKISKFKRFTIITLKDFLMLIYNTFKIGDNKCLGDFIYAFVFRKEFLNCNYNHILILLC